MIKLTKFTGEEFFLNPDTMKYVEHCGDTVVTLLTGEKILVREKGEEIEKLFLEYKRSVNQRLTEVTPL